MLEELKFIENIGRFASCKGTPDTTLKKVVVIHSENGRGKTTLCAILRSLTTGDPAYILERRRVPGPGVPKVVVNSAGADAVFDGTDWKGAGPDVLVFDEHFVDTNVYSGLAVEPGHRQALHGLVIGQAGVAFAQKVDAITSEIAEHKEGLREREAAFTPAMLGRYSVKEFCKLPELDKLEEQLKAATDGVSVLRDAERVRSTDGFTPLGMPVIPAAALEVLDATLPDIEAAALAAVNEHLAIVGSGSEDWVSKGIAFLSPNNPCPFCAQDTSASTIIGHYAAYFSDAYKAHTNSVAAAMTALRRALGGDALARFQRALQAANDRHAFWDEHLELPALDIDSDELEQTWVAARDGLVSALTEKARAPLETVTLPGESKESLLAYRELAERLNAASTALLDQNRNIELAKEKAQHGNLSEEEKHLATLEATQQRFSAECSTLCDAYLETAKDIKGAERKKKEARDALAEHRAQAFKKYETSVNTLLRKFNADFRLEQFGFKDGRGGLSSDYRIGVNKGTVPLAQKGDDPEPTFKTALSAGDRTTLALALFFVQLHEHPGLSDAVIVFDDPVSSLDDHRTFATVDEISHLMGKVDQLIVLSHSDTILCQLWERAGASEIATLAICNAAADASTIKAWDVQAASTDDYDRRYELVKGFADTGVGDTEKVAPALRKILERFTRVAFNDHCPPGTLLGPFLNRVKMAALNGNPVLSDVRWRELNELRIYVNQFHHDSNTNWQESITNVNQQELKGYAQRVVEFTRFAGGLPPGTP